MNEHVNDLDVYLTGLMTQITEAAFKKDLPSIQRFSRKAAELQELRDQLVAVQKRITALIAEETIAPPLPAKEQATGNLRKLTIEVTSGDIRQNLLKLTPHVKKDKIKVGEELVVEAHPSGERFQTVVSNKGNKLRARGEIARFYREAKVESGNFVLLLEITPGRWLLKKKTNDENSP